MKSTRILLALFLAFFLAGNANSQFSLIIFSEKGEKFTAYVNDSPASDKPSSRVATDRPSGPSFKLRVTFEDTSIPEIAKTIFNTPGPEMYYVIRKSDKGKYILEKTSSEYVTHSDETAVPAQTEAKREEVKSEPKPSKEGDKGCTNPMEEPDFIVSREMISNAPFDGPKLTHAKSLANKHCLTTTQIVDLIYLFSTEATRLSFAKHAYKHCWDPGNYNTVKETLRPTSQESLQQYIELQK